MPVARTAEPVFKAVKGARISQKEAQRVGPELFRLARQGILTPEAVVDAARNRRSILHRHFEWNDEAAAYEFRLVQARTLIRSIAIEVKDEQGRVAPVRGLFDVTLEDRTRGYMPTPIVMATPYLRDQIEDRARTEMEAWIGRYKAIASLAEASRVAQEALRKIPRKRRRS